MHPTIDNNLPSINIHFGSTHNHSEISFASHIDSCAAMNVGNLKIHQWFITSHSDKLSHYIQYNDEKLLINTTKLCSWVLWKDER